jgi:hypothetical protein
VFIKKIGPEQIGLILQLGMTLVLAPLLLVFLNFLTNRGRRETIFNLTSQAEYGLPSCAGDVPVSTISKPPPSVGQ